MPRCSTCGQECQSGQCPNCRYRDGRELGEGENPEIDTVTFMHRRHGGRFTADQLQQVTPSER